MKVASSSNKMDFLCVEFSEKLIDDMPLNDPRWAEINSKGKSLGSNLIISNHLKGKLRFHEYNLTFLKKYHLWDGVSLTRLLNIPNATVICHF